MDITGRKLFVKALQEEGVDTIFGYPGGTVTDLFDELYKQDEIEIVLPRHEQGLLHEADVRPMTSPALTFCPAFTKFFDWWL